LTGGFMETRKITVTEVLSPSTVIGDDGETYVLHGVPDTDEVLPTYAAATDYVKSKLGGMTLYVNTETSRELSELPGTLIDVYDADGNSLVPGLSAGVAGFLSGHPLKY